MRKEKHEISSKQWNYYKTKGSKTLWKGAPSKEFTIAMLEKDYYYDAMSGPTSIFSIAFLFISAIAVFNYNGENLLFCICIFLFGCFLILIPDIISYIFRYYTEYCVQEEHILLKIIGFNFKGIKYYKIPFKDLAKVNYVEESDNSGVIRLYMYDAIDLKTLNFKGIKKRQETTLECIPDVVQVCELLNQKIKEYRELNTGREFTGYYTGDETYPTFYIKLALNILIVLSSLYLIDYYILPSKLVETRVSEYGVLQLIGSKVGGEYFTTSGHYFTTNNQLYMGIVESDIELYESSIFGSITEVKTIDFDFEYMKLSDLLGLVRYMYFITVLIFLINRIRLIGQERITQESMLQIVGSSVGLLVFSYFLYSSFN